MSRCGVAARCYGASVVSGLLTLANHELMLCLFIMCTQLGERVFIEGAAEFKAVSANQMKKQKVFEKLAPDLKTDANGVVRKNPEPERQPIHRDRLIQLLLSFLLCRQHGKDNHC